jgi:hypothetical protein
MKKQLLTITLALTASLTTFAQNIWYDNNDVGVDATLSTTNSPGTISVVENPTTPADDVALFATNPITSQTPRSLFFNFPTDLGINGADVTDASPLIISINVYYPSEADAVNLDLNKRVRLHMTGAGNANDQEALATEATWQTLTFTYGTGDISGYLESMELKFIEVVKADSPSTVTAEYNIYVDDVTANMPLVAETVVLSLDSNVSENNELRVVSNPVENTLEVSKEIKSATIYNNLGSAIKTYNNVGETQFDVSSLSTGLYLFQALLENGKTKTLRFIKK